MQSRCEGCGLEVEGGTAGCRALFDELTARDWAQPVSYRIHRMLVDAYSLQHPEPFCHSAKSLAAHLTGLCVAFEHNSHPHVLKAVNRWLSGNAPVRKPELPGERGAMTVGEVHAAAKQGDVAYSAAVQRWARCAWEAYAALHAPARAWVAAALGGS